jgi:peptidoglycan/xylan/chitin deacetylase (PgdA/CDA1 family)
VRLASAVLTRFFPSLAGVGSPDHVALTFDDGPDPRATPHFLDVLRDRGIHATFFLLGDQLRQSPGLGREIAAEGHEIAVHGWRHHLALGPIHDDLARTRDLITLLTGTTPRWYRPPYGVPGWPAMRAARRLGLSPVLWTAWGRDWSARATPRSVLQTVSSDLAGGGTILLHDSDRHASWGSWRVTLSALPSLLDECERRELRVGPLRDHWPSNKFV